MAERAGQPPGPPPHNRHYVRFEKRNPRGVDLVVTSQSGIALGWLPTENQRLPIYVKMRRTRTPNQKQENCPHPETTTTSNAGLKRDVCQSCGYVSFQYAHLSISEEAVALLERRNTDDVALLNGLR